ncbi:MAG: response regulator [Planctomycetaceae bacterium]|nr:response regulator [Planctomycetaceae bacterium]
MSSRVLLVDDDPNILAGYRRHLRRKYELETAECPLQGLEMIQSQPEYAVILSDMQMPKMSGAELLQHARSIAPNSVRLMLTGNADQQTATSAINDGAVFRFLNKPCPPDDLIAAINAGIDQYQLITAERSVLEETLKGSVDVLTDILSIVNPVAFSRAKRMHDYVSRFCEHLSVEKQWELQVAAMLSQLGKVTIPEDVLAKCEADEPLARQEQAMIDNQHTVAAEMLSRIPRMEGVCELIGGQSDMLQSVGGHVSREHQILNAAGRLEQEHARSGNVAEAVVELRQNGGVYDEEFIAALESVVQSLPSSTRSITLRELQRGMKLAAPLKTLQGQVLLGSGQEISAATYARLQNYVGNVDVAEPITVFDQ